jgi:DNA/RNA-binding domain of Phe-tRNA-synthetase-like protein
VLITGVTVEPEVDALNSRIAEVASEIRSKHREADLSNIPEIQAYRSFFGQLGRDPFAHHPALERLLRRVLESEFPRVNNVVDSCSLASLETMTLGDVYDVRNLKGRVKVALAGPGEKPLEFAGGESLAPLPGEVVLCDEQRVLAAYTLGASKVPKVTFATSAVLAVFWNAPGIPRERVENAVGRMALYGRKYCGGHVDEQGVL